MTTATYRQEFVVPAFLPEALREEVMATRKALTDRLVEACAQRWGYPIEQIVARDVRQIPEHAIMVGVGHEWATVFSGPIGQSQALGVYGVACRTASIMSVRVGRGAGAIPAVILGEFPTSPWLPIVARYADGDGEGLGPSWPLYFHEPFLFRDHEHATVQVQAQKAMRATVHVLGVVVEVAGMTIAPDAPSADWRL
ncbi:MAG: hypothetical protein KGK07_17230 [Chloroflexota bacterium]|nr:hypothetical protein [Chloroflexota bacterium]